MIQYEIKCCAKHTLRNKSLVFCSYSQTDLLRLTTMVQMPNAQNVAFFFLVQFRWTCKHIDLSNCTLTNSIITNILETILKQRNGSLPKHRHSALCEWKGTHLCMCWCDVWMQIICHLFELWFLSLQFDNQADFFFLYSFDCKSDSNAPKMYINRAQTAD